jgi:hypothetical protein
MVQIRVHTSYTCISYKTQISGSETMYLPHLAKICHFVLPIIFFATKWPLFPPLFKLLSEKNLSNPSNIKVTMNVCDIHWQKTASDLECVLIPYLVQHNLF